MQMFFPLSIDELFFNHRHFFPLSNYGYKDIRCELQTNYLANDMIHLPVSIVS